MRGPDGESKVYPLTHVVGVRRIRMYLARMRVGNPRAAIRAYGKKLALDPYARLVRAARDRLQAELEKEER